MVCACVDSLFNTYYFVVDGTSLQGMVDSVLKVVSSMRNGVFEGIFFVSMGMFISQLQMKRRIKFGANLVVLLIGYAVLILEIIMTKDLPHVDDHSLFAMFIVVIPSLLLFLSGLPNLKRNTVMLRNYSTGIYFSHRFVLALVLFFVDKQKTAQVFIATIIIVFLSLSILYRINNDKINKVIK